MGWFMDEQRRFQFSLANVFWLTLVVAVMSLGAKLIRGDAYKAWFVTIVALGVPPAVGALIGGLKGLVRGLVVGVWLLVVLAVLAISVG